MLWRAAVRSVSEGSFDACSMQGERYRPKKMARNIWESYIRSMESSDTSVGRATLLIVVSAFSFGSISVLTVLTTGAGVPLLTAMVWRYVLGAVLLGGMAEIKQIRLLSRQRIVQLMLIGGVGPVSYTHLTLHALAY